MQNRLSICSMCLQREVNSSHYSPIIEIWCTFLSYWTQFSCHFKAPSSVQPTYAFALTMCGFDIQYNKNQFHCGPSTCLAPPPNDVSSSERWLCSVFIANSFDTKFGSMLILLYFAKISASAGKCKNTFVYLHLQFIFMESLHQNQIGIERLFMPYVQCIVHRPM